MKLRSLVLIIFSALAFSWVNAQENSWSYRRKVNLVQESTWHTVQIMPSMFDKVSPSFNDIRLLDIDADTVEIPYIIRVQEKQISSESIPLSVINESRKEGAYYITFINSGKTLNHLTLEFEEDNYFATVKIQGSQNNRQWFDIADDQKIFSVNSASETYQYNELVFPASNYDYFRVIVQSQTNLNFRRGSFENETTTTGNYRTIAHRHKVRQNRKAKQTIVDLRFDHFQPVSKIALSISATSDYYRSASVEILRDSVKTEKGWIKNYETVYDGYVTSIHPNDIEFNYRLTSAVRIVINNLDNPPLQINNLNVEGPVVDLAAALTPGNLFLYYGNLSANKPSYDLEHFKANIPSILNAATLGDEESLSRPAEEMTGFFENKTVLYVLMLVVIFVLGFFTIRMMSSKTEQAGQ